MNRPAAPALSTVVSMILSLVAPAALAAVPEKVDVLVYGGTSGGVAAAVQATRMGKSVVLIEPGKHLGGLTSGGLGWTDTGNKSVIGGFAREYYQRLKKHYDRPEAWKHQKPEQYQFYRPQEDAIWAFEPHVAERTFDEYVKEHKVPVVRGERLDRAPGKGVKKDGQRITAIVMES